jgi:excisionase family DNA binding protein
MLTVQEACAKLGISRAALYYAMAAGKLKYTERYGKRLLDERSVAAYRPRSSRAQQSRAHSERH